ncbi:MAG TPA: ABC transporter ATP-binding protein [Xanthobacteraceae bacterium]
MLSVKALHTEYAAANGHSVKAAQDVSFEVPDGALFTLLGPSGCGKTTILRSIAGLERPKSGSIEVAGRIVFCADKGIFVAPNRRNFGMVFQSYAIWPHMNVFKNVAFPLEVRKVRPSRKEIEEKVMRVLAAVKLAGLADRDATKLSGGQQQRLALARALVMEPQLLLLDEPLSNLDAKLREAMRFELKRMQRDFVLTTIYVTHDQSEALALSHEIAVMNEGRIVQIGSPRDIYERPGNKFVADFVGNTNFIDGLLIARAAVGGRCRVATALGELNVQCVDNLAKDAPVVVSVRPEDVELSETAPPGEGDDNLCRGTVEAKVFLGDYLDCQVKVGDSILLARVHPSLQTPAGNPVHVRMRAEKCVAIAEAVAPRAAA